MPESWIKLRDDLDTDPRVFTMADALRSTAGLYVLQHSAKDLFGSVTDAVTRNVMRDVTVAGLSRVWFAANRHTTDGVFRNASLEYLDTLSQVPGFGAAMQLVGYAAFDAATRTVTLPRFDEHNAPDKNGHRSKTAAARRAQRHREKLKAQAQNQAASTLVEQPAPITQRDAVTSRVTPPVTPPVTSRHAESNVTPSLSISSSSSSSSISTSEHSESENSGPRTENNDLAVLETAKDRLNRLRGSWAKLPHWSAEEEAALFAALPNLRAMEPQDWAILAFWLRWAHSHANTESRDPVRVTSRRHAFVTDLAANLDRAVTHWKQTGSPRLNPDGTKASTKILAFKPAPPPPPEALPEPPSANAAAFLGLLQSHGANLPPRAPIVATNP